MFDIFMTPTLPPEHPPKEFLGKHEESDVTVECLKLAKCVFWCRYYICSAYVRLYAPTCSFSSTFSMFF